MLAQSSKFEDIFISLNLSKWSYVLTKLNIRIGLKGYLKAQMGSWCVVSFQQDQEDCLMDSFTVKLKRLISMGLIAAIYLRSDLAYTRSVLG